MRAARRQAEEEGRKEGRKKGVKGARYDFVRGPRRRAAEKEEGKKDLCISENGRKTSARDCESEAAYFSSVAADPTLSPLGQTDR